MANGVFHTGYSIKIELTHPDLGHPDRPGLLDEITQPIDQRDRELLQCLQHHETGRCQAEDHDRSPWMTIRRRTVNGQTTVVAAHLPVRTKATAEESDKHKAMKERIARAAHRHGLAAQTEARSPDGKIRTDVLVTGAAGRIGWEAQYTPITASTVRRRSQTAVDYGITPLWVTNSDRAALIDRAPWAMVGDVPWQAIASRQALLVRAGVRHLQRWKCSRFSERRCPATGHDRQACGRAHALWELPALCIPQKRQTEIDELVVASADGGYVPMRIPAQNNPHSISRMWVPAEDREEWRALVGTSEESPEKAPDRGLTFTMEPLDHTCRYGEETLTFNDRRMRRATGDATGLHTFDDIPRQLLRVPAPTQRNLNITPQQRREAAVLYGCVEWHVGPCAGCATPIHRYGPGSAHACSHCRARVAQTALLHR